MDLAQIVRRGIAVMVAGAALCGVSKGAEVENNYGDWTTGTMPFTTTVRRQDWWDSSGAKTIDIVPDKKRGKTGSLMLEVACGKSDKPPSAEGFFDLRYAPSRFIASKPFDVHVADDGYPTGVDLQGKTIAAYVKPGAGMSGHNHTPSIVQLFVKSCTRVGGVEHWAGLYGECHNVFTKGTIDIRYGNLYEGKVGVVSIRIPSKDALVPAESGYMDPGFDPNNIALIGIKYGLNSMYVGDVEGKLTFESMHILDLDNPAFSFTRIMPGKDVKLLKALLKSKSPKRYADFYTHERGQVTAGPDKVSFPFDDFLDPISEMKKNGYTGITIVNTEYMDNPSATLIGPRDKKSHSIDEIVGAVNLAKAQGLSVTLKPHVDVADDTWRGQIIPSDVDAWFASYKDFITKYATIAQTLGVQKLVVGTEFKSLTTLENRDRWKAIFDGVRQIYTGKLLYAANWDECLAENAPNVCIWEFPDAIGVDAYFPLCATQDPTTKELTAAWTSTSWNSRQYNWVAELEQLHTTTGKDIYFTESGYRSTDFAAREPWEYKEQRAPNPELQARCYQALLETFKDKPWFKGVAWWLRYPYKDIGGALDIGFTPQHKPADTVKK